MIPGATPEQIEALKALCQRCGVARLELFGSAVNGTFDPVRSDLDFFVEFAESGPEGWKGRSARYLGLLHGLEDTFHRRIDLLESDARHHPLFLDLTRPLRQLLYAA
jgi:predicted nucleotidyltransferase